jgi:hypothetical protein
MSVIPVSASLCTFFLVYFRIAETDADVQQRLQKWGKFLESGEVAAGENKMKTNDTENVNSASNKEQKSVVKTADDFEVSEKKSEDNVDRYMEVKD